MFNKEDIVFCTDQLEEVNSFTKLDTDLTEMGKAIGNDFDTVIERLGSIERNMTSDYDAILCENLMLRDDTMALREDAKYLWGILGVMTVILAAIAGTALATVL